jgi:hypothetical protein
MNLIIENGIKLNQIDPLYSSMIGNTAHYKYQNSYYVIAYLKSNNSIYGGTPYLFCGISIAIWNEFISNGLYHSYGSSFHKYIMDKKCECSSDRYMGSSSNNNYNGAINTEAIGYILQEKEKRWNNNYKIFDDYMIEGYNQISKQFSQNEKTEAVKYFKEGLEIYLYNSSRKKIDYSNGEHLKWSIRQLDKVFSFVVEKVNHDRTRNKIETKAETEKNTDVKSKVLYTTRTINTQNLPLRIKPDYASEVLLKIGSDDIIKVIDTTYFPYNYVRVSSKNISGYVNKTYLRAPTEQITSLELNYDSLILNTGHYYTNNVQEFAWDTNQKKWKLYLTDNDSTEFVFHKDVFDFKRSAFNAWKKSNYNFVGIDFKTESYILEDFFGQKILISKDFQTILWFAEKANNGTYTKMYRYADMKKK